MKVWELMSELAKCPAGMEVYLSRGPDTYCVSLDTVDRERDDEGMYLIGDGSESDDEDAPN